MGVSKHVFVHDGRATLERRAAACESFPCGAGQFGNSFKDLIGHSGYELSAPVDEGGQQCTVTVVVRGTDGPASMRFEMAIKDIGRKKGCWMTRSLLRE